MFSIFNIFEKLCFSGLDLRPFGISWSLSGINSEKKESNIKIDTFDLKSGRIYK